MFPIDMAGDPLLYGPAASHSEREEVSEICKLLSDLSASGGIWGTGRASERTFEQRVYRRAGTSKF